MMLHKEYKTREEWLKSRSLSLGASDSSAVLNISPWTNSAELYDSKISGEIKDLSNNQAVVKGTLAEEHIRALFSLDFPQYDVEYHGLRVYRSAYYDFLTATLDGEICDKETKKHIGILEVKTGSFRCQADLDNWKNGEIPQYYGSQICHQLNVCSWAKFVIVAYRLTRDPFKESDKGLPEVISGYAIFNRDEESVKNNMDFIQKKEVEFWKQHILRKNRPSIWLKTEGL